jgi:hypothetical protein
LGSEQSEGRFREKMFTTEEVRRGGGEWGWGQEGLSDYSKYARMQKKVFIT